MRRYALKYARETLYSKLSMDYDTNAIMRCPLMAPNSPAAMSALWSLSGDEQTCHGHRQRDVIEPQTTSAAHNNSACQFPSDQ
jgi:hypothetical protein